MSEAFNAKMTRYPRAYDPACRERELLGMLARAASEFVDSALHPDSCAPPNIQRHAKSMQDILAELDELELRK